MAEEEKKKPLFKLRSDRKSTTKERMDKVDAYFKLNPKIRSKVRRDKYNKLSPKQKKQLASYKTLGEAAMFIGGLSPVGKAAKVTGSIVKGAKALSKTAKKIKPKTKLTKEQMVRTISDKPRPRLPKDQIPKPPSGKVPAVRNTKLSGGKQVPSGGKQVPAKRTSSNVTAPKKMKLGGLKKKPRLRDTIVPLTVATIGASQLGGGPKSGKSKTVGNNTISTTKRKKSRGRSPGASGGPAKVVNNTPDYTPSRGIPKSTAESLPSYFNNPIFKKLMDERGGRKKFEPDTKSGKMSRFGRIGNDSTNKIMAETGYRDLDKIENRTAAEEKLHSQLYDVVMKRKGGKVSKKKGGMVKRSYGGKVKRNMGGMVSPRKKVVFRRGGGRALRGMGKAIYSNKMY